MMGLSLPVLIPNVDHMELFAASSGSSILSVLGTQRFCSIVASTCEFASLECFPKIGELLPEQLLLLVEDEADELPVDPTNGVFQFLVSQLGMQPQYEAGRNGNVILGAEKPGTGTTGVELVWVLLEIQLLSPNIIVCQPWFQW